VPILTEPGFEVDFTAAMTAEYHDHRGHGNSIWNGVDFVVEDTADYLWVEAKAWHPLAIPPHRRGGARWSYICKMRSKPFAQEMRGKFYGTAAFLSLVGRFPSNPPPKPIRFVLLFEPPKPLDAALLVTMNTRMSNLIQRKGVWNRPVYVAVLDLAQWNARFTAYPGRAV
jgi:hypothetical protein